MKINENPISLSDMQLSRYALKKPKGGKYKTVVGLDTETLDGYARLITDSTGRALFSHDIGEYLDFLSYKEYRKTLNIFFNLRYDFQAVIKYLPMENITDLQLSNKTEWEDFIITYIPKKLFNLRKGHHTYTFYDIAQFYHTSLEAVGHKYLGMEKFINPIDRVQLGTNAGYWEGKEDQIKEYCINDSVMTAKAGEVLRDAVKDIIGIYPKRWTSQATMSKYFFRYYCDIPEVRKIPKDVINMALKSYSGGRFETVIKGYIPKGYNIDINSAYPYEIQNLIDVTAGKWKRVRAASETAFYGFYLAKVNIPLMRISPLPYRSKSGLIVYPVGKFYTYLSKREYEEYKDMADINILWGVEFYPDTLIYPFREAINKVYQYKKSTPKKDFRYSVSKIIMNALYGSFYEKHKEGDKLRAGMLFNPVYASVITANTRVKLYDVIRDKQEGVISFATDGILMDYRPSIPYSRELGAWDIEKEADITIIKSGVYRYGDKTRSRGVRKVGKVNTPYGHYNDLWDYLIKQPLLKDYPVLSNRPVQLGEVINFTKVYDKEDLNVFKEKVYNIDINKDNKRIWADVFNNGGEVFTKAIKSLPLTLE